MIADRQFIGPYEVVASLGRGGMGEVYRAHDPRLKRDVAIKMLPPAFAADHERLRRFEQEALAAAALNHPNIVTIHEVGEHNGERYIVMELVEGETLFDKLERGRLSVDETLDIAVQLADGLAHAHEAGIIHRDLKPRNVIVKRDGLVKILDFGLGKVLSGVANNDETTASQSAPGMIVGSAGYMAPEQVLGETLDQRCDQFSLGTVMYEMLSGTRAFRKDSTVLTLSAIVQEDPRPLSEVAPSVPDRLKAIIQRCLSKKRESRYPTTRELAVELRAVRGISPTSSHTMALSGAGSWAVGIFMIILVAVFATAWWIERGRRQASTDSPAQKEVVVLPFANVNADPGSQAFCDGIVELLTANLTQLEQFQSSLRIVPASEVRRGAITSAGEARKAFNATLVVTGSVQQSGDRVRLTMNLVDPTTLRQLKARVIDSQRADVLTLQDAVVAATTSMLELELQPEARAALSAGGTSVQSAYDAYLQGRGYLQRFERLENVDSAIALFTRAVAEDPNFALAHAALGEAYWRKYELAKEPALVDQARTACGRAVGIDDRQAAVRVTLGLIYRGTGEYEAAIREFTRALSIDPVNADAFRELARAYEALGQYALAEATYKKAIDARSGDWSGHSALGRFYASRSRYDDALAQFRRVIELTPDNASAYSNLGGIEFFLKRYDDAARDFERSVAIKPTDVAYSNLGTLYFRLDRYSDAAAAFEQGLRLNDKDYRVWANLASAYRSTGRDQARARDAYRKAAELAESERTVDPRRAQVAADLAEYYAQLGDTDRARERANQAIALQPTDANVMLKLGSAFDVMRDRDRALDWIRRAVEAGYPRDQIAESKAIGEIKKDPRFLAIIRR